MPLYIVSTPIGNLSDMTLRALETLKNTDLLVCEDTRRANLLLTHYKIEKPMISYNEHNEGKRVPYLIGLLKQDKNISLVVNAGTPLVSDPGYRLVKAASENGIMISPVPGPSIVTAALSVAGLPTDSFTFLGFLPKKPGRRKKLLAAIRKETRTYIILVSKERIHTLLKEILDQLGDRKICICRELTKFHEEIIRGQLSFILDNWKQKKGEYTIVLGNSDV
ncbi:16S rRNA (cytidine(1402)-2'-O)-methyltransferase [candidate division WOR-3 bacterium RBG_13_43_14]|uniref:Ribosomal RNA small subunit methyltransferase I n=1 Tax=candidate division WOR-3 bacterium RBG_13_43_14 TaxID=1802590 RepID=A0A1F4U1P7_UNCW3|nr:MAG: 16S rRNA (cytidine(1402)-2'-O)-methyltransferase [candidate division WOR-3 bacterium RBG_13_43_14]